MPSNYDDEGFVAGSFDPVKIYDAPTVALSQMFDNEASFRSLRDTFLDPAALSPAERDSYVSRLKSSLGDNPLANSLLDVALNPFVWFTFITTPAGGNALKATGKAFTGLAKEGKDYFRYVTGRYNVLTTGLGLLNAHQYLAGTPGTSVLHSLSTRLSEMTRSDLLSMQPYVSETLENISKKFGVTVKSLDPNDAPAAVATINGESVSLREYLRKFNVYAYMHMAGMNKDVVRTSATITPNIQAEVFRGKGKGRIKYNVEGIDPEVQALYEQVKGERLAARIELDELNKIDLETLGRKERSATEIKIVELKDRIRRQREYENRIIHERILKKKGDAPKDFYRIDMTPGAPTELIRTGDRAPLVVHRKNYLDRAIDGKGVTRQWLQREGFMPLLDASRDRMKSRYVDLFGKKEVFEKTGAIEYDDVKLARIFYSLSNSRSGRTAEEISNLLHKELQGYVGEDGYKRIIDAMVPDAKGQVRMTAEEFKDLLKEVRGKSDDVDNFMSRNVWSYVDSKGGGIEKNRTDSIRVTRKDRTASLSGRVSERNALAPRIDSDDLKILQEDYMRRGLKAETDADMFALEEMVKKASEYEMKAPHSTAGGRVQVMNLDYNTSFNRYLKQTRNDVALHVDDATLDPFILRTKDSAEFKQMMAEGKPGERSRKERKALGYIGRSRYDYLTYVTDTIASSEDKVGRLGGERAREYIMGTLVERMRGAMPLRDFVSETATRASMDMADAMANSPAFKQIEAMGGIPAKFVQKMREYGAMSLDDTRGGLIGRGLTSAFYVSHLGLNLGSAVLNLMQPLMYAATWMDPDVMIKAYGRAIKQYFGYIQDRLKLGVNADPMSVDRLRAKHFRLSNVEMQGREMPLDLLDIRKTDYELLDSEAFAAEASGLQKKGAFNFWATEAPMKLFTHTEMFNRVVTGEAMLGQMKKAGRLSDLLEDGARGVYRVSGGSKLSDVELVENVKDMVQNTQFGSDLMNSPQLFQTTAFGLPWVRQFFTFPTRTLTAWTDTAPMVNQGRRTWGVLGFETQGRWTAMTHDLMRMMGTSAIVYEVGKNLAGIDLSRGLAGNALYESTIVGPLLVEGPDKAAYNLPLSPALSIIQDSFQALTDEDTSLIGTVLPRFVPGGIAASRLMNAMPRIFETKGWAGGLQRESADWSAVNAEGQVPIYRADGSLLEYRSAARTILGGLGFNSYMFKTDQELNSFLVKNRQAVVDERRKYVDAILANDMAKAARIQNAFQQRFKFPLSVSKAQMDSAIQLREVPLKERMYQRLSADFRPVVKPYLVERLETLKSRTPEELDLSTAEKARMLPSSFGEFDPYQFVTD